MTYITTSNISSLKLNDRPKLVKHSEIISAVHLIESYYTLLIIIHLEIFPTANLVNSSTSGIALLVSGTVGPLLKSPVIVPISEPMIGMPSSIHIV